MKQWHKLLLITFHAVMLALSIYILVNIYSHLSKKTGNPGSVVGVACLTVRVTLFLSRIEIEECFFYVPGFFELAGKILYGILLLLCADSKGFLSAKQIFLLLAFPPKPFVAVEPLGLS